MFPTIAEYNQTLQRSGSNAFTALKGLIFIPSRTVPIKIFSYGSGSYAVVFKAKDNFNTYAIRCFISVEQESIERYKAISGHLNSINVPWSVNLSLLENEIEVNGMYYPVLKMDWINGKMLNDYIGEILDSFDLLTNLQKEIIGLSSSLEANCIGHGDIQCSNVIVQTTVENKAVIRLIDYDGMYIPVFRNKASLEKGRGEFQHPLRAMAAFNEKIDRFSFWVILTTLEALKFDKSLWLPVMQGGYNTLDNTLFTGTDFSNFSSSKLADRLYALNRPSLSFYLDKLNSFLNSSPDAVDTPVMYEYSGIKYNDRVEAFINTAAIEEKETVEILSNPTGATVLTSTFKKIGITPLKIDKRTFLNQTLTIAYGTEFKPVRIEETATVITIGFEKKELQSPPFGGEVNTGELKEVNNVIGIVLTILAVGVIVMIIVALIYEKTASGYVTNSVEPVLEVSSNNDLAVADSAVATIDTGATMVCPVMDNMPIIDSAAATIDSAAITVNPAINITTDESKVMIKGFLLAEDNRDFLAILSYFSKDMERYWNIQNPTIQQLYNNYHQNWAVTSHPTNILIAVEKVDARTFIYTTDFSFYSIKDKVFKTKSNSRVQIVFNDRYEIVSILGIN